MYSYTEPREAVLDYERWLLSTQDGWQEATVAEGQRHGKTVIVRIDGYDDRDQAARLIGTEIGVPRDRRRSVCRLQKTKGFGDSRSLPLPVERANQQGL